MAVRGWIIPFLCVFLTVGCAKMGLADQDYEAFCRRPYKQFHEPYAKAYEARQNPRPQPPPVSDKWLEILDREVKANGGKIPIDPRISVVVDREGSGKEYFEPATDREKAYARGFHQVEEPGHVSVPDRRGPRGLSRIIQS